MPFNRILVAIDGSEASDRALRKALELAKVTRAQPTGLAIEGPLPAYAATIGHFLRGRLLGSTADRVAENAPCPVMIVR
jgi:nucleotide-binding universal stress UspA family protein